MTVVKPARSLLEALSVDRDAPTPAYLQLKRNIEEAILSGELPAESALPAERELAEGLQISRMTIRRAIDLLVRDDRLERRHGSGTYVRRAPVEQVVDRVQSFSSESRSLGIKPGTRLLEVHEGPQDPKVASVLGLLPGEPTLSLTRLRTADGEPLAIQRATLPRRFATLSLDLLRSLDSLYATLAEQYGVRITGARQTVTARLPTEREQRWLAIDAHDPVLALERISYDQNDEVAEYVQSAYHGRRYRMALELKPSELNFREEDA